MCERHESSQIFGEKQGRCRWLTVRTRLRDEEVSACGGSVAAGEESAGSRSCCKTSTNVENKQQEVLPPSDHVRPADLPMLQGISDDYRDLSQIEAFLYERDIDYVMYQDWKILDQYEVACGARQGRPRVKVTTVPEMMAIIRQGR